MVECIYIFWKRRKLNDQAKNKCHFHFKTAKGRWKLNNLKVTCAPALFQRRAQDLMIDVDSRLASLSPAGHAAEAQWQIAEQGVEEEVCHPL